MKKNILITIAIIVVAGITSWFVSPKVVPVQPNLGAIAGPDIPYSYLSVAGLRTEFHKQALNTASSTLCAIQSPNATSTLDEWGLQIKTSTSTAITLEDAVASGPTSTTTLLSPIISVGSGVLGTAQLYASSTNVQLDAATTFAPLKWLVWKVSGTAIADSTKLNGFCQAQFTVEQ